MRIGFYCESPADRAAMAVFAEGILGAAPEPISMDLEARSYPGIISALDGVFRGVHYGSDAEGFVVVVDCDDSPLHSPDHDAPPGGEPACRFCRAQQIIASARRHLKRRPGQPELKVAVGLPVPAIEAWYLAGKNHEVGEPGWIVGLANGRPPFTRPQLKKLVYGTDRPSLELETECAVREARRIITDMSAIETALPAGFGLMARTIRSWVAPPTEAS
jgi:hypothetical protein